MKFNLHEILEKRFLTGSTFVLKMERRDLEFVPGQHVQVGKPGSIHAREYSIYSAKDDDFIEILVKEVEKGLVTPVLKKMNRGDILAVSEAVGYFTMDNKPGKGTKFLFVATGTGISPFHSFVKSYPGLSYKVLHGVRYSNEAYGSYIHDAGNLVVCTTRGVKGDFNGRVTNWLQQNPVEPGTPCYLCGNCNMINDVYDILTKQGIKPGEILTEVYF